MSCEVILNIDGQKVNLGTIEKKGNSISEIENMLKGKSIQELQKILEMFPKYTAAANIKIDDINENSVGLSSPAELINSFKDKDTKELLIGLNLPKNILKSKIVISGFGGNDVKTGYYNGHIFLNLDYIYDNNNKAIAVTELALYDYSPTDYKTNSDIMNYGTEEEKNELLNNLIKDSFTNKQKLIDKIKFIYKEVALKRNLDITETSDFLNKYDSVNEVNNEFREAMDVTFGKRELNYEPTELTPIKNLKQGDLVLIKYADKSVYEIFYDYNVNIDGNIILTTLTNQEKVGTRKTLIDSNYIPARKFSKPETVVYKTNKYSSIKNTKFSKILPSNLIKLIKQGKIKVKTEKGSKFENVSEIQGNTVKVNNEYFELKNIKDLEIAIPDTTGFKKYTQEEINNNDATWQAVQFGVLDGDHILLHEKKEDVDFIEGIVLSHGLITDSKTNTTTKVVFYITNDNKIKHVSEKNIRYVTSPQLDSRILVSEELNVKQNIQKIFNLDLLNKDSLSEFIRPKKREAFEEMSYSIQQINSKSIIENNDYLYEKSSGNVLKVLYSDNNYIKTTKLVNGVNRYVDLPNDDIILSKYLLLSEKPLNKTFAQNSIIKNRYTVGNTPYLNNTTSKETKIFKAKNGYIYAADKPFNGESAIDITEEYKKVLTARYNWSKIPDKLYIYESNDLKSKGILKDTNNSVRIAVNNSIWEESFGKLIPGMTVLFEGNAKPFTIEKVIGDNVLVSYYHYTQSKNNNEPVEDLKYVRSEKFLIPKVLPNSVNVVQLYIPKWATSTYQDIKKFVPLTPPDNNVKLSYVTSYSKSDSPEIIVQMAKLLENKFGVKINMINNEDLINFKDLGVENSAAFVYKGGVFVNIDKASIEEPLHEVLHLILATMKGSDSDTYYNLVNSVQYHPLFDEVSKFYTGDINTEKLEETFVKLLSRTVRKNIIGNDIFTQDLFDKAIKKSISDILSLSEGLELENTLDLLSRPIEDVMTAFGSKLVENPEGLIDENNAFKMFDIAGKIKELLKNDQLVQDCNY